MVVENPIKSPNGNTHLLSFKDPNDLVFSTKAYYAHYHLTKPPFSFKSSTGRTNLVVEYSIVVGDSTVRFCGLALFMRSMVERVVEDTSVRFCGFAHYNNDRLYTQ